MTPLSDPPLLIHWLFEQPADLWMLMGIVAVVCLILGYHWADGRFLIGAAAAVMVALVVYVLSWLVVTDREQLVARTQQVVAAAAPLDLDTMGRYFTEEAVLCGPNGQPWKHRRDLLSLAERVDHKYTISTHTVRSVRAETTGGRHGRTLLDLRTELASATYSVPYKTLWLMSWVRGEDGRWLVDKVQWLDHPDPNGIKPRRGLW